MNPGDGGWLAYKTKGCARAQPFVLIHCGDNKIAGLSGLHWMTLAIIDAGVLVVDGGGYGEAVAYALIADLTGRSFSPVSARSGQS